MEKLISIIVPVYNAEDYIEQCMQSILENDYKNIEVIAINDGSTDKSSEKLRGFSLADNRVKVVNKENGGVSEARNVGLDIARGEYVTFVDADDYIKPKMIRDLVSKLEENKCDIAFCTRCRIYHDIEIEGDVEYSVKVFNISELNISETNTIYDWSISFGKLYRRDLIGSVRFPKDIKYGEDLYFATDVWKNAKKAVYVNSAYYGYRYNQLSASFTLGETKLKDRIIASGHAWEWIADHCPNSKMAMFDLCFGAYTSAFSELKGSKRRKVYKEYCEFFMRNPIKKPKGYLFLALPRLFTKMQEMKSRR